MSFIAPVFAIRPGYSYARDRLTSHLAFGIERVHERSGEQHSGETWVIVRNVLIDVVSVVDEYSTFSSHRRVGPFNYVEMAQALLEAMQATRAHGLAPVIQLEEEVKILAPVLAGLKRLVIERDCDGTADPLPNDVQQLLALRGPAEVDTTILFLDQFFRSRGLPLLKSPEAQGVTAGPPVGTTGWAVFFGSVATIGTMLFPLALPHYRGAVLLPFVAFLAVFWFLFVGLVRIRFNRESRSSLSASAARRFLRTLGETAP